MVQMFSCPISSTRDGELHHRLSTIEGQTGLETQAKCYYYILSVKVHLFLFLIG